MVIFGSRDSDPPDGGVEAVRVPPTKFAETHSVFALFCRRAGPWEDRTSALRLSRVNFRLTGFFGGRPAGREHRGPCADCGYGGATA